MAIRLTVTKSFVTYSSGHFKFAYTAERSRSAEAFAGNLIPIDIENKQIAGLGDGCLHQNLIFYEYVAVLVRLQ